jgi:crotonobetainyl-CoA:carnitine CoA-transferase CaiB-like acyl-CoA transferase
MSRPLDGVRVLAAEQMQALPYATQLLARLGADVVKVEHPVHGESGRGATPHMLDPEGRVVGATFLRNNLGKRSVGIDLKTEAGRDLFLQLVPRFDVVAENFKAGTMDRLGLGYEVVADRHPAAIYVSVSGFGNTGETPYRDWPAYASIVEAMSGVYEWGRRPGEPPRPNPVGALGDISSALFAVIGVLAALRERDRTGQGQRVDIAMLDSVMAMTDVVTNLWSLGQRWDEPMQLILEAFAASDGHVVMQVVREHQFERLAELIGRPEWLDDPRFADRAGWAEHLDTEIRPAVEAWMATRTRMEAVLELSAAGIAAGPCLTPPEVVDDPHVAARHMLVEMERTDGVAEPVLVPGNPVKLAGHADPAEPPGTRVPWVGEHTAALLEAELGLGADELAELRDQGVVGP